MIISYHHDLNLLDEQDKSGIKKYRTLTLSTFWHYTIISFLITCITSIIIFATLWILILLLNPTSHILNIIVSIIATIGVISFAIIFSIIGIAEIKKKYISN